MVAAEMVAVDLGLSSISGESSIWLKLMMMMMQAVGGGQFDDDDDAGRRRGVPRCAAVGDMPPKQTKGVPVPIVFVVPEVVSSITGLGFSLQEELAQIMPEITPDLPAETVATFSEAINPRKINPDETNQCQKPTRKKTKLPSKNEIKKLKKDVQNEDKESDKGNQNLTDTPEEEVCNLDKGEGEVSKPRSRVKRRAPRLAYQKKKQPEKKSDNKQFDDSEDVFVEDQRKKSVKKPKESNVVTAAKNTKTKGGKIDSAAKNKKTTEKKKTRVKKQIDISAEKEKEAEEDDNLNEVAAENQPAKNKVDVQNSVEEPKVKKEQKLKKEKINLKEEGSEVPRIIVPKSNLRVRTSPSPIYGLIDYLTDEQKEAVREIGFGGLLKLTLRENQMDLICFLLNVFDFSGCSLDMRRGELVIGEEDVLSVFDLPQGKGVVNEMSLLKGNENFDKFVRDYRRRWDLEWGSPLLKVMEESLIERQYYGDDFKRDFVVVAVTSLFHSNQDRNVNLRILDSLYDVNEIKNLNWCAYVIQKLLSTVNDWRKSKASKPWFTCPSVLLMLCYLDRVEFKAHVQNQRTFPVCSNWKSKDVRKRLDKESDAGGFGNGIILDCLRKPEDENDEKDKKADSRTVKRLKNVFDKMTSAVNEFKDVMGDMGKDPSKIERVLKKPFDDEYNSSQEAKMEQMPEIRRDPSLLPETNKYNDLFRDPDYFSNPETGHSLFGFWDACFIRKAKNQNDGVEGISTLVANAKNETKRDTEKSTFVPKANTESKDVIDESEEDIHDVLIRANEYRYFRYLHVKLKSAFWKNNGKLLKEIVTKKEQIISDYAFGRMDSKNKREILFHGLGHKALKKDFVTLRSEQWVFIQCDTDCGVYTMRHLETYNGSKTWDCGFVKEKDSVILNTLRAKYCSAIIMMPINNKKDEVLRKARSNTMICKM
ncbi:hypothetical protein CASFOL_009346 [Castilleja foliolosa]|uniref:Uncharacterized protein n=1 Tax=Castilleja foliolosa TaxID=1961234 RepID=A0ABD3DYV8_9LAMI